MFLKLGEWLPSWTEKHQLCSNFCAWLCTPIPLGRSSEDQGLGPTPPFKLEAFKLLSYIPFLLDLLLRAGCERTGQWAEKHDRIMRHHREGSIVIICMGISFSLGFERRRNETGRKQSRDHFQWRDWCLGRLGNEQFPQPRGSLHR